MVGRRRPAFADPARRVAGVCLLVAALVPLTAAVAQESWYELPVKEHVLDNGLKLLVLERPADHRVAAKIFTSFGAVVERPGQLGAAHFLEHLMFKGTRELGTTDWEAERPLIEAINRAESALIEELNRAQNALQVRSVFGEYRHEASTPAADSIRREIARLNEAVQPYRLHGAMMRWYQAYGGQKLTATTEQEYMKFDINLPAERVELFFRIEADRMRNSVFREFDEERMILVEQRYGDLNNPTTPFFEQLNAAAGQVHPVFWPEGYPTDFYQYTRAYERELYEQYFVPNNTTIVLIGGVTMADVIPLATRYFGAMERGSAPPRVPAVEPVPRAERRVVYRTADLPPRVEMRFLIPGVGHPDRPVVDVAARAGTFAIRAALETAQIDATVTADTRVVHETRFGVPATVNFATVIRTEDEIHAVEAVMLEAFEHLATQGPTAAQVDLARKQLRHEWFLRARDMDRLAFDIGHFEVMHSWRTLESYLLQRERTASADVRALAARYFIPSNRTVGIVLGPAAQ